MTVLSGAQIVTPTGILRDAWVQIDHRVIVAIGEGVPPIENETGPAPMRGAWLLPGFIDIHMHGGGGFDVTRSPDEMRAAVAFHQQHGTTSNLVSLVTAPVSALRQQLRWVAELTAEKRGVLGAHLEGPFLAQAKCGAQNVAHLLAPDLAVLNELLEAADGCLASITIAPELPGAIELIRAAIGAGVVVAVGHSMATYGQTQDAYEAGATLATHLFNAMTPLHHRDPGIAGASLKRAGACEIINDGVHVHPAITTIVARTAKLVLITDAIAAAGAPDGPYELGGQRVEVVLGQARLAGTDVLAGSTLTMDRAFRSAVTEGGLTVADASAGASTNAARVLRRDHEYGSIAIGRNADLVVLDEDLSLRHTMKDGQWIRP
jgi:N-acetylglucosamine-6-phosphate deacetylase